MSSLRLAFVIDAIDRATAPIKRITATMNGLTAPAQNVRAAFGAVLGSVASIVRTSAAAGVALAGVFAGFKRSADAVDNLSDAAKSVGMTTQKFQELGFAAQLSGSSQEEMGQGLIFLSKNMAEAVTGSKEMQLWFQRVGVSMKDLKSGDAGLVLERIADRFNAVGDAGENSQKKVLATMALTGRSGARWIQLLNGGGKGIRDLREEARRLGVVLSDETVKAMGDFNDGWDRMRMVISSSLATVFRPVAPVLQEIVGNVTGWVVANRALIASRLEAFIKTVKDGLPAFVAGVRGVARAFWQALGFINQVAQSLGGWPSMLALLAGLMGARLVLSVLELAAALGVLSAAAWANPLTWITAGVVALVAALPLLILHFDEVIERLRQLSELFPDWLRNPDNWAVLKLLPDIQWRCPALC